jgi:uncharacterized protein (TIGR02599 family)
MRVSLLKWRSRAKRRRGFTLVELLVSIVILAFMVTAISVIGNQTNQIWTSSNRRIEQFQNARNAFEVMTRTISQATLNSYYDYFNSGGQSLSAFVGANGGSNSGFIATSYGRVSDLEFVSGSYLVTNLARNGLTSITGSGYPPSQITHAIFFAAPLSYTTTPASYGNLDNLLCACGFYIQYSLNPAVPGFFAPTSPAASAYRYRLMEVVSPTENFPLYSSSSNSWIKSSSWVPSNANVHQIASNIIALVISPEDPYPPATYSAIGPTYVAQRYDYDSRVNGNIKPYAGITSTATSRGLTYAQLPPILHIAMVAIDEQSALKMGNTSAPPTNLGLSALFTTAANMEADLATLQNNLNAIPGNAAGNKIPLNCHVFETRIALHESKWSSN